MKKETIKRRRKEIFEAALEVFAKKGFDKATLDEIAEKLNITKPALYIYFRNKEELFCSMVEDKLKKLTTGLKPIFNAKIPSLEKLKRVIEYHINFDKENMNFFKVVHNAKLKIGSDEKTRLRNEFLKKYKKYTEKLSYLVQQCINDGYLKKDDKYFYTFALLGMINQNIFGTILFKNEKFIKNLHKKVFNLFLKGAGPENENT